MILASSPIRCSSPVTSGGVEGVLIESWEANEDYTVHTWTVRDGISFHDGTPLDAAAVAFNINACRFSPLTGAALTSIADVQADGQVLTITTASPHVPLAENFAGEPSTCKYMLSPTWLSSLPDIPFRTEGTPFYSEEIAATPADGDPAAPVGVGAFVFESYTPGNGNSFVGVRNEDYWRGPNGSTGEDLPYLDQIEFVVAVDIASRSAALRSGEFDVIHTANSDEIAALQDDDEINVIAANDFGETSYIMLNTAEGENAALGGVPMDPEGVNASSPFLNLSCRKALAHATDNARLADERGAGIVEPANGPFPPGTIGYLEDTGYPQFDIDAAQAEFETCKADAGTDTIQIVFNTTNDPFNIETNQLVADMWGEAFGDEIEVSIAPIEQGQYIGLALTGCLPGLRLAQSRRYRSRSAVPVVDRPPRRHRSVRWRSTSAASRTPSSTRTSPSSVRAPIRPYARRPPKRSTDPSVRTSGTSGTPGRSGASPPVLRSRTSPHRRPRTIRHLRPTVAGRHEIAQVLVPRG